MRAAWVVIGVALGFASGCAQTDWIDRTLVTVDVTGVWEGEVASGTVRRQLTLTLAQSGSKVTGQMAASGSSVYLGPLEGPIDGTVSGDIFSSKTEGDG